MTIRIGRSPSAPRPDSPVVLEVADMIRRIEINYDREGAGPGSRFEGKLREDLQAQAIIRFLFDHLTGQPCRNAIECLRTMAQARPSVAPPPMTTPTNDYR